MLRQRFDLQDLALLKDRSKCIRRLGSYDYALLASKCECPFADGLYPQAAHVLMYQYVQRARSENLQAGMEPVWDAELNRIEVAAPEPVPVVAPPAAAHALPEPPKVALPDPRLRKLKLSQQASAKTLMAWMGDQAPPVRPRDIIAAMLTTGTGTSQTWAFLLADMVKAGFLNQPARGLYQVAHV